jgi:hypothetical protein
MEAAPHFNRDNLPAAMVGKLADVIELTPPEATEGIFESSATRPNPVVHRELIDSDKTKHGQTQVEIFTMENGRHLEVVTATPRKQRSDIAILNGTALGTSIRGHNWHTMLNMMDLGFPVVMIGPEGGHPRWPKTPSELQQFAKNLGSISLLETSRNYHEILNVTDAAEIYTSGEIIKTGESRAACITMPFNALAGRYDRQVVFSDAISPCFPVPKPIQLNHEAIDRLKDVGTQVGSIARHATHIDFDKFVHYPKTLNLNPHFLMHMVASVPTLVSGKAGELVDHIPRDARIHNTHFDNDPWAFPDGWEAVFSNHPFVTHDRQPGDHGAIVKAETQKKRISRLRNLRDELEANNQDPSNVDWHNVYLGKFAVAAA